MTALTNGHRATASDLWPDLPFFPDTPGVLLPWFPASELMEAQTTEERWLVDELIPAETINMLVGNPGTGKSLLVLDLCCCVVTGTPFLGRAVRQGRVMYLAAEDGWARVAKRLREWGDGQHRTPADLKEFYVLPSSIQIAAGEGQDDLADATVEAWAQLQADIEALDPVLVVLDPLVDVYVGLDENKASEMAPLVRGLRKLVRNQDRVLLITHHDRKGSTEPNVYSSRGSGSLAGGMDGIYHATPVPPKAAEEEEEHLAVMLHITKGRDLPPSLKRPFGARYRAGHWHVDESIQTAKKEKELALLRQLYDLLVRTGRALSVREAEANLGIAYNTARAYLTRLVEVGAALLVSERPAQFVANPGARGQIR